MGGIGSTIYYSVPLILIGLSFGVAFKSGIFNIGTAGQYVFGAVSAICVAIWFEPFLGNFTWLLAVVVAAGFGLVWALLIGILKTSFNVNSIISGIMLNYIGIFLVNWFVRSKPGLFYEGGKNWTMQIPGNTIIPRLGMDTLFAGKPANIGIFVAIAAAIIIWYIFRKTTIGYEMRATGLNAEAARYAGINVNRSALISMAIAGILAGLGGGFYYLSATGTHYIVIDAIKMEGFTGIAVALLGLLNPIGTVFAGLFVSFLKVGGQNMQAFGIQSEIVEVITAIIIFSCAISFKFKALWIGFIEKIRSKQS